MKFYFERIRANRGEQRHRSKTVAMLLLVALLTGCAVLAPEQNEDPLWADMAEVEEPGVMEYYRWLDDADIYARSTQRHKLDTAFYEQGSIDAGLKLALLLSVNANAPDEDVDRALDVLQDVMSDIRHGKLREMDSLAAYSAFAELWQDVLLERQVLKSTLRKQYRANEQLREENVMLTEQIEALKVIEQQMNIREQLQEGPLE